VAGSFDLKEKIEELVDKLKSDPKLLAGFKSDPIKTVEKLVGIDLPDDKLQPLVAGIKTKLAAGDVADKLGGLKKLF